MVSNTVTPYLFSVVRVGQDDVDLEYWRILLGVVPVARVSIRVPLSDIAGVRVAPCFHGERFVAAGLVALLGVAVARWPVLRVCLWLLAAVLALVGVVAVIRVSTAGQRYDVPVCLREIGRARRLCDVLDERRRGSAAAVDGGAGTAAT